MRTILAIIALISLSMFGCSRPANPTSPVQAAPVTAPGNPSLAQIVPGGNITIPIAASDIDGDNLSYYARNLPPGAAFDEATATFNWTPGKGQYGIYPGVRFYVSDGQAADSEDITIYVSSGNHPPDFPSPGIIPAVKGQPLSLTLAASDVDGDPLDYQARNLPPGAGISGGALTWTPPEAGTWPGITIIVSDGQAEARQNLIIAVK